MIKFDENFFNSFKFRWLKSKELYYFLKTIPKLILGKYINLSYFPQEKPKSHYLLIPGGEFFIYPLSVNNWRNDNHNWKKRPDSTYFNESNLALKINGNPV